MVGFRVALALLSLACVATAVAVPAHAQGSLTVNPAMSLEAVEWQGDVQPGVPANLLVRLTNRAASPDSFRLSATVDGTGWEAAPEFARTRTLAPAGSVPFPDPGTPGSPMPSTLLFNVTVTAPSFAPAGLVLPVTVLASSTNSTTAHETLTVNATVLAVHRVSVTCSPGRLTLAEGGFATLDVTVSNLGNAADEVRLEVEAPGSLAAAFGPSSVLLGADAAAPVVANVTAAPDAEGSHRLEVRAQSLRDATAGDLCAVTVTVTEAAPRSTSKDSPAPTFVPILAAALFAVVLARRRS